jgi:hypothetical protein
MAERSWHIEIAPAPRAGWSDDAVAAGTRPKAVALGARRPRESILLAIVLAGLAMAVLKPWGGSAIQQIARPLPAVQAPVTAAGPTAAPITAPAIADEVFAPPARTCMRDMGWRVCAAGVTVAGDQAVRNNFAPDAMPMSDEGGKPAEADPVVVLSTMSGAALAFYAPDGFYIPDAPTLLPTPHPAETDPQPAIASGSVVVSVWHVDETIGSRTLPLLAVGPITPRGRVAANVFVPQSAAFSGLEAWPAGRYIVWLKGGGLHSWEAFFDFEVVGEATTTAP